MLDNKYFNSELLYEDSFCNLGRVVKLKDGSFFTIGSIHKDVRPMTKVGKTQYVYGRRSTDGGKTYDEFTFIYALPQRESHACLQNFMIDRDGRLHLAIANITHYDNNFIGNANGHYKDHYKGDIWHLRFDDYRGTNPLFHRLDCLPRYTGSMNNFIQLRSGRLIAPFSTLVDNGRSVYVSQNCYSDDNGETWKVSNDVEVASDEKHSESGAVEPVVVETSVDNHLIMLMRTVLGRFYYATSVDGGASWTEAHPTNIPSSNAPATLEKTSDGRILILWNDVFGMPMHGTRYSMARQSLAAALSDDDLRTIKGVRVFCRKEQRDPDVVLNCYPFADFDSNGDAIVRNGVVDSWKGETWHETTVHSVRLPLGWIEDKAFNWSFNDGFGPWVVDPAGSEETAGCCGTMIKLFKDEKSGRPGFAEVNFPYGTSGKATLKCRGENGKIRFIAQQVYLDVTNFIKSEMTDKYGKYVADEYTEATLTVPDACSELTVTWKDGMVTFAIGDEKVETVLPSHIKGINHLCVLAEDAAVTIGDFACETNGDLETGIEF